MKNGDYEGLSNCPNERSYTIGGFSTAAQGTDASGAGDRWRGLIVGWFKRPSGNRDS